MEGSGEKGEKGGKNRMRVLVKQALGGIKGSDLDGAKGWGGKREGGKAVKRFWRKWGCFKGKREWPKQSHVRR